MNNQATLKNIVEKLPRFLQQKWGKEVYKLRRTEPMPTLLDVTQFVRAAALELSDPVFGMMDRQASTGPSKLNHFSHHKVLMMEGHRRNKCWNCTEDHWPDECPVYLHLSPSEGLQRAKEKHVCFACLKVAGRGHRASTCTKKRQCPRCESVHHKLLHVEPALYKQQALVCNEDGRGVLPVISVEMGQRICNAVFDSGASVTFIREELARQCKFESEPVQVEIETVGGEVKVHNTRAYKVKLRSMSQSTTFSVLAVGVPEITQLQEISPGLRQRFEVLIGEHTHRGSGTVDLLIGVNHAQMHVGEIKESQGYVARKSSLGWVIFGSKGEPVSNHVLFAQLAKPVDLSQFWSTEEMGVRGDTEEESPQALGMWKSCEKIDGHWMVPYPWLKPPEDLPDNRKQCLAQMKATESRLKRDPKSADTYNNAIEELVERKFARKLTEEEILEYKGPVYHSPHHAVIRKESKSTPIRIVFNSSSKYGECINDYWYKGPELLQSLVGIILRFRQYETAIVGDISKMYYQVRIPERDQQVHRFLWWIFEERSPDTYVLQVVTPGDKSAPALAITALHRTAKEAENDYPEAARIVTRDSYMDDICSSVTKDMDGQQLRLTTVLASGGFKVKKWVSNGDLQECNVVRGTESAGSGVESRN